MNTAEKSTQAYQAFILSGLREGWIPPDTVFLLGKFSLTQWLRREFPSGDLTQHPAGNPVAAMESDK